MLKIEVATRQRSALGTDRTLGTGRGGWRAYLAMARIDHWFKNVFVIPGIIVALGSVPPPSWSALAIRSLLGLLSIGLIASSNYTLNEILDAPFDRFHPSKRERPLTAGRARAGPAYVQWLLLFIAGMCLASLVSMPFALSLLTLWVMGCVYNIPPARSKDRPFLDVLTEAVNNPIRMMAGWFIVTSVTLPPASLLLAYWMIGCYFMALKRYAELRGFGDLRAAAQYRRSFAYYTPERLIVTVMFYAAAAMLFFGAFCMRYRLELILAFPLVALVMSLYLNVALKPNSAAQHPEYLYRELALVASLLTTALLMLMLLRVDMPGLHSLFTPTAPAQYGTPTSQGPRR